MRAALVERKLAKSSSKGSIIALFPPNQIEQTVLTFISEEEKRQYLTNGYIHIVVVVWSNQAHAARCLDPENAALLLASDCVCLLLYDSSAVSLK